MTPDLDRPRPIHAELQDWQKVRYGDKESARVALAYWRERGWRVDDPTWTHAAQVKEAETRVYAFMDGYEAALKSQPPEDEHTVTAQPVTREFVDMPANDRLHQPLRAPGEPHCRFHDGRCTVCGEPESGMCNRDPSEEPQGGGCETPEQPDSTWLREEMCGRCNKPKMAHMRGPRGLACYPGEDLCWLPRREAAPPRDPVPEQRWWARERTLLIDRQEALEAKLQETEQRLAALTAELEALRG